MTSVVSNRTNLLALNEAEMAGFVSQLGWPKYRAHQILRWLYQSRVKSPADMTNLSRADRELLTYCPPKTGPGNSCWISLTGSRFIQC